MLTKNATLTTPKLIVTVQAVAEVVVFMQGLAVLIRIPNTNQANHQAQKVVLAVRQDILGAKRGAVFV